jgi:selenocysteine lyase/cysteine desulfurase
MIACQRHLFQIPDDVAYLNCAYMSPLMKSTVEAGNAGLARKAQPWNISADDFFTGSEQLRSLAARLFNSSADEIALVPSASYGLQTSAQNIPVARGQKILVLEEQFPSNIYPWRRLARESGAEIVTVPWPKDGDWTAAVLQHLKNDVGIAALPNVQWTSGGVLDLETIGAACRTIGAALVLDLTQSLGAYPFDVKRVQPDFAVAAAYKWLLGPYSSGVMYVSPRWHSGRPLEENWIQRDNARNFSNLYYTDSYQSGARRFDMGEHANFGLLPATIRSLQQLDEWGVPAISQTIAAMTARIVESLNDSGLTAWPEKFRAPHYLCLRLEGSIPEGLVASLASERVYISLRGTSLRITPHLYNSIEDIERLVSILQRSFTVQHR